MNSTISSKNKRSKKIGKRRKLRGGDLSLDSKVYLNLLTPMLLKWGRARYYTRNQCVSFDLEIVSILVGSFVLTRETFLGYLVDSMITLGIYALVRRTSYSSDLELNELLGLVPWYIGTSNTTRYLITNL
jgi:hypothetical protein